MQALSTMSQTTFTRPIVAPKNAGVEVDLLPGESFERSTIDAIKECATNLYEKAPIAGNIALTAGIGLTSALVAAGAAVVMPAAVTIATTAMALGGGMVACYATLNDGDTIDQGVRTFVGGAVAALAGPVVAAEGIAAGLFFGGAGVLMMTKEK